MNVSFGTQSYHLGSYLVNMSAIELYTDKDLAQCKEFFLILLEHEDSTRKEQAELLGISERTLFYRINHWKKTGAWFVVEQEVMNVKSAHIDGAILEVVGNYPTMIRMIQHDVMNAERPADRHRAFKLLHETVIMPYLDRKQHEGSEEMTYISEQHHFLPTDIPLLDDEDAED